MLKKQASELLHNTSTDTNELFTKGASVKLLAGKMDVGSKELSKVSLCHFKCEKPKLVFCTGSPNCVIESCIQSYTAMTIFTILLHLPLLIYSDFCI